MDTSDLWVEWLEDICMRLQVAGSIPLRPRRARFLHEKLHDL
jgi:hypothetical protein